MAIANSPVEKRRELRHSVNEPCRAKMHNGEYDGAVVNMSVSGAAIHLDIELEVEPEIGAIVELQMPRVGLIRTRVVRPLIGGIAVELLFNPTEDRALIAKLWRVLNEYAPAAERA